MADSPSPPQAPSPEPSTRALRRAKLFWEQADQDHRAARELQRQHQPLQASYLCFQAALNALSCVCYLNGKWQLPNFSATQLASMCAEFDPGFESVRADADALETVQQRGPFDAAPDAGALMTLSQASLDRAAHVMDAVRSYLKANRKRFFAP